MKNKKGFTLVELLAVIVVLAIILIIAIPNVLDAMTNSKKSSLVLEARKSLSAAMQKVQSDALMGTARKDCYTLAEVGVDGGGKYSGVIKITGTTGGTDYTISITDGEYYIVDKKSSDLTNASVVEDSGGTNWKVTCS